MANNVSKLGFLACPLHPLTGCWGVEICRNGSGPHPALRLHGRLPRRHAGCVCWKTHRAQHGVKPPTGNGSSASTATEVRSWGVETHLMLCLFSPPLSHTNRCSWCRPRLVEVFGLSLSASYLKSLVTKKCFSIVAFLIFCTVWNYCGTLWWDLWVCCCDCYVNKIFILFSHLAAWSVWVRGFN